MYVCIDFVCVYIATVFLARWSFAITTTGKYVYERIPGRSSAAMVTSTFLFDRRRARKTRVRQKCVHVQKEILNTDLQE